jgi:RNA polymerase sigma-70 factor (ECF subfamily)
MDKKEFESLFYSHFAMLVNFASTFLHDEDNAKEIVQDVFIRLWQKREEMNKQKSVKSYLFTSVRNRSLNFIRNHKKFQNEYLDIEQAIDTEFAVEISGEDNLEEKIEAALQKLPPKCRRIFEMSRFEEKKYRVIADELEISQKTVEAQMSKALRILRVELKDLMLLLLLLYELGDKCR